MKIGSYFKNSYRVVGVLLVMGFASQVSVAQEETEAGKDVIEFGRKQASSYRIVAGEQELEFNDKAVLSWTNPARNSKHGTVFFWTDKGRVATVACIYMDKKNEIWRHEFQSLTTSRLKATQEQDLVWSTKEQGIQWQELDSTFDVESKPERMLLQFRKLAEGFKARLFGSEIEELRLLRQPLFRYSSSEHQVIDGVVFAFVQGTNPEVLLIIEASSDKEMPWRFALARMTGYGVNVNLPDGTEWRANRAGVGSSNLTYFNRLVEKVPGSPD